jgi:CheY-like chemotaxis protein
MLRRLIGEDIELVQVLDPGLGRAKIDPSQFEQAVINLVVNARDAMPRAGRLTIETLNRTLDETFTSRHPELRPGDYVVVNVTDTGHGMDEQTKTRIFEPFFTTKEASKGTGLGLAMVYGFVKQSGGHIEVDSRPGHGTTFTLYLARTEEAEASTSAEGKETGIPKGSETILLVEDEEAVRTLTHLVLESYGYTVLVASDGQHGLDTAERHPGTIEVLVTDVVMPRLGGRELAEQLLRVRPNVKVVFMSGYTEDGGLRRGDGPTGTAFMHKPFSPLALARTVRHLLDS